MEETVAVPGDDPELHTAVGQPALGLGEGGVAGTPPSRAPPRLLLLRLLPLLSARDRAGPASCSLSRRSSAAPDSRAVRGGLCLLGRPSQRFVHHGMLERDALQDRLVDHVIGE